MGHAYAKTRIGRKGKKHRAKFDSTLPRGGAGSGIRSGLIQSGRFGTLPLPAVETAQKADGTVTWSISMPGAIDWKRLVNSPLTLPSVGEPIIAVTPLALPEAKPRTAAEQKSHLTSLVENALLDRLLGDMVPYTSGCAGRHDGWACTHHRAGKHYAFLDDPTPGIAPVCSWETAPVDSHAAIAGMEALEADSKWAQYVRHSMPNNYPIPNNYANILNMESQSWRGTNTLGAVVQSTGLPVPTEILTPPFPAGVLDAEITKAITLLAQSEALRKMEEETR